ncbi:lysozyme 3-like [Drosophila hydei]|uniref:lysozyme n=1 Tax=Drosophila hydei TaxID=7224 RepID=A0A6J1LCA2_DROHY|nr:lysozyme 3-like [Drosophila hydei]
MLSNRIFLLFSVFSVWALFSIRHIGADKEVVNKPVTEDCLECLCEAMSGCNATKICVNGACGIFRITWTYWRAGGSLAVPSMDAVDGDAFTDCVNDPHCAADTIQNYMYKNAQDCNGDNVINCKDYGAIHKMGNLQCQRDLPAIFGRIFFKCLERKERETPEGKNKSN